MYVNIYWNRHKSLLYWTFLSKHYSIQCSYMYIKMSNNILFQMTSDTQQHQDTWNQYRPIPEIQVHAISLLFCINFLPKRFLFRFIDRSYNLCKVAIEKEDDSLLASIIRLSFLAIQRIGCRINILNNYHQSDFDEM